MINPTLDALHWHLIIEQAMNLSNTEVVSFSSPPPHPRKEMSSGFSKDSLPFHLTIKFKRRLLYCSHNEMD